MGDHGGGHVPPDDLASIALDEERAARDGAQAAALAHLSECARCREALAALRRVVAAARAASPGDRLVRPPPRVWQAIVDAERARASAPALAPEEDAAGPDDRTPAGGGSGTPGA
ncbi:hypothetical protein [Streptomyces sp. NPDC058964]|uniref:hypothetical protein n=1 Tax=Streptomyces sp. NPDC058964 TaxID=3346681 RepID=UPI0036A95219